MFAKGSKRGFVLWVSFLLAFLASPYFKNLSEAQNAPTKTTVFLFEGSLHLVNILSGEEGDLDEDGHNVGEMGADGKVKTWRDESPGDDFDELTDKEDKLEERFEDRDEEDDERPSSDDSDSGPDPEYFL